MKSQLFYLLPFMWAFFLSCNGTEKKELHPRVIAIRDSLDAVRRVEESEKPAKDSLAKLEQDKAIGEIMFGISEKQFNQDKSKFLEKCKVPKSERYSSTIVTDYRLGDYGFNSLDGWFNDDSLYRVRLSGGAIKYNNYERLMPEQHEALLTVLKGKYLSPTKNYGLPNRITIKEGFVYHSAIWEVGSKEIQTGISGGSAEYYLNLIIVEPAIEKKVKAEEERKEQESAKKGTEIL